MRTYIYSALIAVSFGLLTVAPASANGQWTCMSPSFGCGSAPSATRHHSRDAYVGERSHRRQASGKRSRHRVAKHEGSSRRVARNVERHEKSKVDLPERKQASVERKDKTAERTAPVGERKAETEKAYRTTGSQSGMASYYGSESGSQTASGARFNPSAMTAAHRTLPFGTKVRVTNKNNGRSVIVTINDRGPFIRGRIIDLSTAAAGVIGMKGAGVARVTVERLGG